MEPLFTKKALIRATKEAARQIYHVALTRGEVTKEPCEVCGETITDAHHVNYEEPLNVRYLCRKHHLLEHTGDKRNTRDKSMIYSIKAVLHNYAGKDGLSKVNLQVIFRRMKVYVGTSIKVSADNFADGVIIKHKNKSHYNDVLSSQKISIEKMLLDAIREDKIKNKSDLINAVRSTPNKNKNSIYDFTLGLTQKLQGKLSEGRLRHYKVIANKIEEYAPKATFGDVSVQWVNGFETWLRSKGLDGNTVLSNMSLFISILNKAHAEDEVDKKQFELYKRPQYDQKLVEYLNEEELTKIKLAADITDRPSYKRAAYYFLLSAFTGYRISDSKRFNYEEMVKGNMIVLRATKNKQIVSIPLYPQLREIVDFVKDNPLDLSEDKTRVYVKEICKFVGIKKDVNYHMSRHSFAMFLRSKGFNIEEIATLLGDSPEIAKIYARISNTHLKDKFNERLGR